MAPDPVPDHRHDQHGDAGIKRRPQIRRKGDDDEAESLHPDAKKRNIREKRRLITQSIHFIFSDETLTEAILAPADGNPGHGARKA